MTQVKTETLNRDDVAHALNHLIFQKHFEPLDAKITLSGTSTIVTKDENENIEMIVLMKVSQNMYDDFIDNLSSNKYIDWNKVEENRINFLDKHKISKNTTSFKTHVLIIHQVEDMKMIMTFVENFHNDSLYNNENTETAPIIEINDEIEKQKVLNKITSFLYKNDFEVIDDNYKTQYAETHIAKNNDTLVFILRQVVDARETKNIPKHVLDENSAQLHIWEFTKNEKNKKIMKDITQISLSGLTIAVTNNAQNQALLRFDSDIYAYRKNNNYDENEDDQNE